MRRFMAAPSANNVLVGIGATVLNNAVIGDDCLIGCRVGMLAFRYQRAGTDQAVIADDGIVEDRRTDAHQHVVADGASHEAPHVANVQPSRL